ncbi:GSCFA domain-containing protein [Maribacter sp. CXY002]|uniref:GSCFA domain-containing protein n=1 Tax=Maribacter luteocoastalis TaxID=3407671 RepID=UPI003B67A741
MKLQTQIPLQKSDNQMDYDSQVLLMGSCFSENIGNKLTYHKFRTLQNPFGILYTPLAIEKCIAAAIRNTGLSEKHLVQYNDKWQSLDVHSDLSRKTKKATVEALERALVKTGQFLQNATHVFLTMGTSWAYTYKTTGEFIANCHKIPSKQFDKVLIPHERLVSSLLNTIELLTSVNPEVQVVITISPIRHLKDGFVENQLSKANLISAVHQVVANTKVAYFPAYEILLDELRDYRFYAEDMVHPNKLAVDYIWEKFNKVYISDKAMKTMAEVASVQRGLQHRPFDVSSSAHQNFMKSLQQKIAYIKEEYPFMDFKQSNS